MGSMFNMRNLGKAWMLVRDHRPDQVINTFRFAYHAWRGFPEAELPYDPTWLDLFITSRCNLRCEHCAYGNPLSPREPQVSRDMPMDMYIGILDRFRGAIAVALAGGEPLLHPGFVDMVCQAHRRCMKVHVPTNGTLLAGRVKELLGAPIEMLNVSIYGTDGESFGALTGGRKTLFEETVRAVRELAHGRRRGGYPRILRTSFICTKETMHRAVDFIRLSERLGVDQVRLKNFTPFGIPGYGEEMCLREGDPEVEAFIGRLRAERFHVPVYLPRLYRERYEPRQCDMRYRMLTIDGDGNIARCCVEGPMKRWGNIFREKEVWNGRVMLAARRQMRDSARSLPPLCMHCEEMIPERFRVGVER